MPSFLDAAYHVLKDMDRPMSAEEITQQAVDRGLLVTIGKTPAATMSASIYMDIKEKGGASRFIQSGLNRFVVNKEPKARPEPDFDPKPKAKKTIKGQPLAHTDTAHKLLDHEISAIRAFLGGLSANPPTSEKLCDWVTMCYTIGLFSEGMALFGFVDPLEVNDWYYSRTKKLARLCTIHQESSSKGKV